MNRNLVGITGELSWPVLWTRVLLRLPRSASARSCSRNITGLLMNCLKLVYPARPAGKNAARRLTGYIVPICGISLALAAHGSDIPPFTAEGTVLTEVFQQAAGPATARMEETVVFCYSNGWWRVELKYKSGFHSRIPPQSLEGNTIICESIPEGVRILTSHTPSPKTNGYVVADVEATEFPPPDRQNLLVCWLTLLPNPRLPLLNKTTMRRLVSADFLEDPQNQGEYGLKYGDGGVFISELCITNNGIIQVARKSTGQGYTRKLPPPFDQGHFEFEYKVLEATNWAGLSFPSRSVLRKYVATKDGTSRDDVRVAVIESFKLESFRAGEIPKPQIDSKRLVQIDTRLPRILGRD